MWYWDVTVSLGHTGRFIWVHTAKGHSTGRGTVAFGR